MHTKLIVLTLLAALLAACRGEAEPGKAAAYTVIRESAIAAGEPIPPPTGPVILTITGQIRQHNVGDSLQFDMETLEQLGLVEYSVEDKQAEGRTAVFQGVLMSQLLAAAGVAEDVATLYTVALNDYAVEIPVADVMAYPVLLATAVDGQRMPLERYGPTRVIYPYSAYDLDETIYDPRWIWQLASIDVR